MFSFSQNRFLLLLIFISVESLRYKEKKYSKKKKKRIKRKAGKIAKEFFFGWRGKKKSKVLKGAIKIED